LGFLNHFLNQSSTFLRLNLSLSLNLLAFLLFDLEVCTFDSIGVDEKSVELKTAHFVDVSLLVLLRHFTEWNLLFVSELGPFLTD
jgi:hypothetical protein